MSCTACNLPAPATSSSGLCWPCAFPRDYWRPEFWQACAPERGIDESAEQADDG